MYFTVRFYLSNQTHYSRLNKSEYIAVASWKKFSNSDHIQHSWSCLNELNLDRYAFFTLIPMLMIWSGTMQNSNWQFQNIVVVYIVFLCFSCGNQTLLAHFSRIMSASYYIPVHIYLFNSIFKLGWILINLISFSNPSYIFLVWIFSGIWSEDFST